MKKQTNNSNEIMIKKSNSLIGAKYKSSLLENKLLAISFTRLQIKDNEIIAELYPNEIRQLMGHTTDTNIYRKLKHVAKVMNGRQIVMEDGNGNFRSFSMINNVDYIDKIFKVTFNKNMKPYLFNLNSNFTFFSLGTLMTFEKNCSYRIYEILKKDAFRCNPQVDNGVVTREFNLNEFRCMIGLVNLDEPDVKDAVARGVSWDDIYEKIALQRQYPDWRDLKKKVIEPAKIELEELSDIKFTYDVIRSGPGAKIRRIIFHISKNDLSQEKYELIRTKERMIVQKNKEIGTMSLLDALDKSRLLKYVDNVKLSEEDIDGFLEYAGYDIDKVENAIIMANKQSNISNYVGWIISCIREGYAEPIEVVDGSAEKAEAINSLKDLAHSISTQERAWERIKTKDDFQDFLNDIQLSLSALELTFDDIVERIELYTNWKKGL